MNKHREQYLRRLQALRTEQSSWRDHWRELSDYIRPYKGRFYASDRNKGTKRNDKIINGTARRAHRILTSGMMAGITSPARPWYRLTTPDPELAEVGAVKAWLHLVEERMRLAFSKSNVYKCLHTVYEDLALFGTAALHIDEDFEDGLRGYNFPIGQYYLANSSRLRVDTVFRELSMTVGQLVEKFGLEACTPNVQDLHKRGELDKWIDVVHAIEPNRDYQHGKLGPKGMLYRSCWMEIAGDATTGLLDERGYEEFPLMAPRWAVNGEDVYGTSPAMDALGDAKALQLYERRKAQAIDKIVDPPMKGPAEMLDTPVSLLPHAFNPVPTSGHGNTFEPAVVIHPQTLSAIGEQIVRHEDRVNEIFYADLWLMLAESDRREITAREVAERHEEKMLQLGPVLEQLQDELLDPLIDRAFAILLRNGHLGKPPEELQGQQLRVEYISVLAQAQKLIGITSIERGATFTLEVAKARPDVLDRINWDGVISEYFDALGTPPTVLNPDEAVAKIRQERAAQQQAQRQGEAATMAADGAKTLSETKLQDDSALTRLMSAMGAPVPQGGA